MNEQPEKLVVLWTSGDRDVALNMVMMYTLNSRLHNWWQEVTLLIWGASSTLLSQDEELQLYIPKLKEVGVEVIACKKCSENLGVVEKLEQLGVKVFYTGETLTQFLKSDAKILTI